LPGGGSGSAGMAESSALEAGPIPGLFLGRLPLESVKRAMAEVEEIQTSLLRHQVGENIVFHLNLPFPINFPTAPVFSLDNPKVGAIQAVAAQALSAFRLEGEAPYAGMATMHGIVRIYEQHCHIGWHKDRRYFEDCVVGVVLQNDLPGGEGLRFRPDARHAHQGDEFALKEVAGDCFMFQGDARNGWEHGFRMPEVTAGRRVSLTMRFYRMNHRQGAQGIGRWAQGMKHGMKGILFLHLMTNPQQSLDVATKPANCARCKVEYHEMPSSTTFPKLRRVVAQRLRLTPADIDDISLVWRDEQLQITRDNWYATKTRYIAQQEVQPVLRLVVTQGEQLNLQIGNVLAAVEEDRPNPHVRTVQPPSEPTELEAVASGKQTVCHESSAEGCM